MNPNNNGRRPTEVASPPIEHVGVTPSRTRMIAVGARLSRAGVTPSRARPETAGARQRWRIAVRERVGAHPEGATEGRKNKP